MSNVGEDNSELEPNQIMKILVFDHAESVPHPYIGLALSLREGLSYCLSKLMTVFVGYL